MPSEEPSQGLGRLTVISNDYSSKTCKIFPYIFDNDVQNDLNGIKLPNISITFSKWHP